MAKSHTPANIEAVAEALQAYIWATIEAKNLLRCISIAADNAEGVDDGLRPSIGLAVDGVARLLQGVSREFGDVDMEVPNG